ncbi:MAG: fibronectin type III domain-containing protein [Elusimicrobia bacterium]|nr:fibronectin type III domain-containing protein [Elusimicrobiota bacterium]
MGFRKTISLITALLLCPLLNASALPTLGTTRHSHTATLLPDGNFLMTGGVTGSGNTPTGSAEIYVTSAKAFQAIGAITQRSSHTATVLGDGRVLVAGGFNNGTPLNTAYVLDNRTNVWSPVGSNMLYARGGHTANLINKGLNAGDVLICGGQTAANYTLAGGITGTCEIFDTKATAAPYFKPAASMAAARMNHAAATLNSGNVFVSGGMQWDSVAADFVYLPDNEIYDVVHDSWTPVTALLQGRASHTITPLDNGDVMIAGGYNKANFFNLDTEEKWYYDNADAEAAQNAGSHGYLDAAEFFDPAGRGVVNGASSSVMPYRTSSHAAALSASGEVKVDGGYGNMVPTFFDPNNPACSAGSYLRLTPTATLGTASIDSVNSSKVTFPLDIPLTSPVSGRVVNGDIFFSLPKTAGGPSFSVATFQAILGRSTTSLAGQPIGRVTSPDINAGKFTTDVTLTNPIGGAGVFAPMTNTPIDIAHGGTSAFSFASVKAGQGGALTGTVTLNVTFNVSSKYYSAIPGITSHIAGQAVIKAGTISDLSYVYNVKLKSGTGTIPAGTTIGAGGAVTVSIPFTGITGTVNNLTSDTNYILLASSVNASNTPAYSPPGLHPAGITNDDISGLSLDITYTSDYVDLSDAKYDINTSSFVVREMIFSTNLGFKSNDFTWDTTSEAYDSDAPRFNHTYMITPAGDELITGGRNCEVPTTNCAGKTFTATTAQSLIVTIPGAGVTTTSGGWADEKALNEKRAYHTSTLLADGSILTCGGSDGTITSDTCELRDPVTGNWNYAGSMFSRRSRHTATLLPNGTVFVTGGTTGASTAAVATTEMYYPKTKRWVRTQSMSVPRQNHTATLMSDGNVLVTGGSSDTGYSAASEIFISTSAMWQTVGSLTKGRAQHTATLLNNGNVLVTGGVNGVALRTTEIFDHVLRTWSGGPIMYTPRYSHTATLFKDGKVLVTGGSNGNGPRTTTELLSPPYTGPWDPTADRDMLHERANHRATLLTTGKILLTGGETLGATRKEAELFNTDFDFWQGYGEAQNRANHTAVLGLNGYVFVIGGWDGTQYLNGVQSVYFAPYPDVFDMAPRNRNPQVSTAAVVDYLDRGQRLTLLSDAANFHGVTEASGGGAGPASSSFSNPRVYLQAMDAPSGFLMDLTTGIYKIFTTPTEVNPSWANTLSSITVTLPLTAAEIPYGYYYARAEANGQYSNGRVVQITKPRPTGLAVNISTSDIGISSITWTWNSGDIKNNIPLPDGYNLYSSTDNLFISTASYGDFASYTQTGLSPNTQISINIAAYNFGGDGPLSHSATFYTLAAAPTGLTVTGASFETAALTWNPNGNSAATPYEISVYQESDAATEPAFTYAANISTPVPFSINYLSTSTVINTLSPNKTYYFRVRAKNGDGFLTAYDNKFYTQTVSTITVGNIANLQGIANNMSEITWSWDESAGATSYSIYDVTTGTDTENAALLSDTVSGNYYTQKNLLTNTAHSVAVKAKKLVTSTAWLDGPMSYSGRVYTLAVTPTANGMNTFTDVSTGSLTVNWITNGNSSATIYDAQLSLNSNFDIGPVVTTQVTDCIAGCAATFSGLKPNYKYYAAVLAYNGDGKVTAPLFFDPKYKYTRAQPPSNVRPTLISMDGVVLSWDTVDNSTETVYEVRSSTAGFGQSVTIEKSFANYYTASSLPLTGLLTSTTYYLDVAACNGEGVGLGCTSVGVTARSQCVPNAITLPGPGGAPSGSIAGVSSPSAATTIHGFLPTSREVWLTVPAASFKQATNIAISSFPARPDVTDACHYLLGGSKALEFAIYSQGNAQPLNPVTIKLTYDLLTDPNGVAAINNNRARLVVARYNPATTQCLPLETQIDTGLRTITATLNHFSTLDPLHAIDQPSLPYHLGGTFQLILSTASTGLSNVRVFPNPFYTNRGNGYVTIDSMPASAKVNIYTLSGDKIWTGTAGTTGFIIWKGVNKHGELVASGIYLAVIDSTAGKKILKIAVER